MRKVKQLPDSAINKRKKVETALDEIGEALQEIGISFDDHMEESGPFKAASYTKSMA
ncbi:MAG: hypothetical protein JNJ61_12710 [Anaerolineae bacterium]|nr:hypothetical protein [Anaerolineae bacterium]